MAMTHGEPKGSLGIELSVGPYGRQAPPGLPKAPGVYIFKDGSGRVIYVGKAKDIRKRVRSYFKPPEAMSRTWKFFLSRILKR